MLSNNFYFKQKEFVNDAHHLSVSKASGNPSAVFESLTKHKQKFGLVEQIFNQVMTPSYGPQPAVLKDIKERVDRKTEILTDQGRDVGCIVYKRELVNDYASMGIRDCFEVTLLALFDHQNDASKGYRTLLLNRIEEAARRAKAENIVFRVSEKMGNYVRFLERKDCQKNQLSLINGIKEFLFYKGLQKRRKVDTEDEEKIVATPPAPSASNAGYKTPIHLADGSHQLTLKKPYIQPIRSGAKSIEGRINSGAPSKFKVGDKLRFFYPQNESDDVTCIITKIDKFSGFREMLETTGFQKCIPAARTLDEAFKVYENIPGFLDRARHSGVLAIYLAVEKK